VRVDGVRLQANYLGGQIKTNLDSAGERITVSMDSKAVSFNLGNSIRLKDFSTPHSAKTLNPTGRQIEVADSYRLL